MSLSAASWIIQRLREQQAIKQARDAAQRRKMEELRTGRATEEQAPERPNERDRMQDLAARRQAQLRELRMRQAQQGTPPTIPVPTNRPPVVLRSPTGGPPALPKQPAPGPILIPTPKRQPKQQQRPQRQQPIATPTQQQPQRQQQRAPVAPRPRQMPIAPPVVEPAPVPTTRSVRSLDIDDTHHTLARQQSGAQRLLDAVNRAPTPAARLGRMMVLGEILGPPMAARTEREPM